jgi:hypothetical protein
VAHSILFTGHRSQSFALRIGTPYNACKRLAAVSSGTRYWWWPIAPKKAGVISMDADVAAAMQLRVQSKVKMQVEREIHAETQAAAGLIHQSEARALLERAVYEAVADTREEEQAAARALVDREVTSVVLIRDAEAAAAKALADATLIETIERERQEAMERQVQAVDLAVASTVANERKRVRMTSIVKAVSHAADKKAAVTAAIAAMQKKAAVSSMLKGAANSTKHAEETAKAAEEAVRAQEAAITQAVASTREECARELELAVEVAEAAAAKRLEAALEAEATKLEAAKAEAAAKLAAERARAQAELEAAKAEAEAAMATAKAEAEAAMEAAMAQAAAEKAAALAEAAAAHEAAMAVATAATEAAAAAEEAALEKLAAQEMEAAAELAATKAAAAQELAAAMALAAGELATQKAEHAAAVVELREVAIKEQAAAVEAAVVQTTASVTNELTAAFEAASADLSTRSKITAQWSKGSAVAQLRAGKEAEATAAAAAATAAQAAAVEQAIKRTRDEMQKEHAEQMRAALEEEAAYAAAESAGAASTGHVQEGEDQGGGGGGGRSLASRMAARAERAALVAELVESEAAVALLSRRLNASEMATEEAIRAYEATIADQQAPLWPNTGKKMRPALWERPRSPHAILETMYVHALSSDELRAELFSELLHSSTLPAGLTSKLHATAPLTAVRSRAELVHHGAQHGAHMEPRQPFTIEAAPQIDTSRIISRSKSTASLSSAPRPALQDATTATTTIERRPQPPIAFSKPQPATYSKPSPPLTSREQLFPPVVASAGVRRDLRAAQVLVPTVTKHGLVWQPQPQSQPQPQPQHSGGGGGVGYREAGERSRVAVPALTLTTGRTLREVVFAPA